MANVQNVQEKHGADNVTLTSSVTVNQSANERPRRGRIDAALIFREASLLTANRRGAAEPRGEGGRCY